LHVTLRIKVVAKIKILAGNQVVQLWSFESLQYPNEVV
jgi:hypothetical protein